MKKGYNNRHNRSERYNSKHHRDERDFGLVDGVTINNDGKMTRDGIGDYKYYGVLCKMGHAGKNSFIPTILAVKAKDAKAAAQIARFVGRVKHDRKDAIIFTHEITKKEYAIISDINDNDPFMQVHDMVTQKQIDKTIAHRVMKEPTCEEDGLTAETESYGEGHSLQNFIVANLPYNKRTHQIVIDSYIEENRELWERKAKSAAKVEVIDEQFKEEVETAVNEYRQGAKNTPKTEQKSTKNQDDGQCQV